MKVKKQVVVFLAAALFAAPLCAWLVDRAQLSGYGAHYFISLGYAYFVSFALMLAVRTLRLTHRLSIVLSCAIGVVVCADIALHLLFPTYSGAGAWAYLPSIEGVLAGMAVSFALMGHMTGSPAPVLLFEEQAAPFAGQPVETTDEE